MSKFRTAYNIIKFKILEKNYQGVKYIYQKSGRENKTLLISFSAMPPNNFRVYNNVRGFSNLPVDRLFIKDSWGYRGSYYLYENGSLDPFFSTCALIEKISNQGKYTNIITAGTSKGGTCAIIFGIKYNAKYIFSGACQYYIGDYLAVPVHEDILKAMQGNLEREEIIKRLNEVVPSMINSYAKKNSSIIHLIFSKKEHTYTSHISDLIDCLKRNNLKVVEKEYSFTNHSDVGYYFLNYINEYFKEKINQE